jgi:hypothetical protein
MALGIPVAPTKAIPPTPGAGSPQPTTPSSQNPDYPWANNYQPRPTYGSVASIGQPLTGNGSIPGTMGPYANPTRYQPPPAYGGDAFIALLAQMGKSNDLSLWNTTLGAQNQMGIANATRDLGVRQLGEQAGFDRGLLANARFRDVDLERSQLAAGQGRDIGQYTADLANLAAQLGFSGQEFGINGIANGRNRELVHRGYANSALYNNQGRDFADRDVQLGFQANGLQNRQANRQLRSETVTRGGGLSAGFRDSRQELMQQLGIGNAQQQLGYDSTIAGLDNADRQAQAERDGSLVGLDRLDSTNQLGWDKAQSDNRYNVGNVERDFAAKQQAAKDRSRYLDSLAKDYGIKASEIEASLKRGIERLGLDSASTIAQIAAGLESSNAQHRAAALNLQQQALSYAAGPSSARGTVQPTRSAQQPTNRVTTPVAGQPGYYNTSGMSLGNGEFILPGTGRAF